MKTVTIVPAELDSQGIARSQGTKVLTDEGEVHGIKSIKINLGVDERVTADIELVVGFNEMPGVVPKYMMRHPVTNIMEEIASIQFASGEILALQLLSIKGQNEIDITNLSSTSRQFKKAE
jgi:hypothetical protein